MLVVLYGQFRCQPGDFLFYFFPGNRDVYKTLSIKALSFLAKISPGEHQGKSPYNRFTGCKAKKQKIYNLC